MLANSVKLTTQIHVTSWTGGWSMDGKDKDESSSADIPEKGIVDITLTK